MASATPESATPTEMPTSTRRRVTELFTRDEIRMLNERSDLMGFAAVGFTWGVIVATLAMLVWAKGQSPWIAIPAFIVGFVILAGRHLALAILHHDAAHTSLFKTRWLNEWIGDWFCARPGWNHLVRYRAHHFVHHGKTNQPEDTDISLVVSLPTTRASLVRKFARDLLGLTGLKYVAGRILMDAGILKWTVANDVVWLPREGRRWWSHPVEFVKNAGGMLATNAVFLIACWASGHAWLYGVWVAAYLTPYPLFVRIRSMAEHACTDRGRDMFLNTRTTRAGFLARATVAPIRVNYHLEHHVMPAAPYYRLPLLHTMLRQRGASDSPPGYVDVLAIVTAEREVAAAVATT